MDKHSDYSTVYVGPNQVPLITKDRAATNHQQVVEWENYALMTSSQERIDALIAYMNVPHQTETNLLNAFGVPPLLVYKPESSFLTLYTSIYRPWSTSMKVFWEGNELNQSIASFTEKIYYKKFKINLLK